MRLRCASWEAVSSKPQVEKVSLSDQRAANQRKIAELGGDCIATLTVPGQSRDIVLFEEACQQIEAYAQLRDLVVNHQIDLLVYYTKSRLGRTIALCETVVAFCWQHDVAVYDLAAPPSTLNATEQRSSAGDTLTGAFMSWRSQNEVSELKDRHRKGMIERVEKGNLPSNLKWGMVKTYAPDGTFKIEIEEQAAQVIKRIAALYLDGRGAFAITEQLNSEGLLRDGLPWNIPQVKQMLKGMARYAGFVEINRVSKKRPYTKAKGNYAAVIDEDTLNRLEAEKQQRRTQQRQPEAPYIYSRLVRCAGCNHNMICNAKASLRTDRNTGKSYYYPALMCRTCKRRLSFRKVERAIADWMKSKAQQLGVLDAEQNGTQGRLLTQEISRIAGLLAENQKAHERVTVAYTDGVMPYADYKKQLDRLNGVRDGLKQQQETTQQQLDRWEHRQANLARLADIPAIYKMLLETGDIPRINAWLRDVFTIVFQMNRAIDIIIK